MKKFLLLVIIITSIFAFESCCVCLKQSDKMNQNAQLPAPQVIIYKTKADYSRLVPITLSADKKTVISYPDIRDISRDGKFTYPTSLKQGYWLDNRGISADVAFLRLSYEEYAALPKTPSSEFLYAMILTRNPLKKMYACGLRHKFQDPEKELNQAIDSGNLSSFTRLK